MHFSKFVPLFLVMVLDLILTLAGQPDCYWDDHSQCNEANIIGRGLLSTSPMHFAGSFILYAFLIFYAIFRLPKLLSYVVFLRAFFRLLKLLSYIVFLAAFLGHFWGSASWIPILFSRLLSLEIERWSLYPGYLAVIAIVYGACLYGASKLKPSKASA